MSKIDNMKPVDMVALYDELGSFKECAEKVGCTVVEWASRWYKYIVDNKITEGFGKEKIVNTDKIVDNSVSRKVIVGTGDHNPYKVPTKDNITYPSLYDNTAYNYDGEFSTVSNIKWYTENDVDNSERYSIAVISDTHFGSNYQALTPLKRFAALCQERGIETLLHGGDICEGLMFRRGAVHERFLHGIDDITEYCVANLPDGFNIKAISGNHDDSLGRRAEGFDLGFAIERQRPDFEYFPVNGNINDVCVVDGGIKVQLLHGMGSCGKNRTMRTQNKSVELLGMNVAADIVCLGHCHISSYVPNYFGMHVFGLGSFQSYTPFLSMKGMVPDVCGLIISYDVCNKKAVNVATEYVFASELGGIRKNDF